MFQTSAFYLPSSKLVVFNVYKWVLSHKAQQPTDIFPHQVAMGLWLFQGDHCELTTAEVSGWQARGREGEAHGAGVRVVRFRLIREKKCYYIFVGGCLKRFLYFLASSYLQERCIFRIIQPPQRAIIYCKAIPPENYVVNDSLRLLWSRWYWFPWE